MGGTCVLATQYAAYRLLSLCISGIISGWSRAELIQALATWATESSGNCRTSSSRASVRAAVTDSVREIFFCSRAAEGMRRSSRQLQAQ